MKYLSILFLFFSKVLIAQTDPDNLYQDFIKGYDALNAEAVARLYLDDAVILNLYDGADPNAVKAMENIRNYFQSFFERVDANQQKVKVTFKITQREKTGNTIYDNGFYRLEYSSQGQINRMSYGKLSAILEKSNGHWRFKVDAQTNTTAEEYEKASGKLIH